MLSALPVSAAGSQFGSGAQTSVGRRHDLRRELRQGAGRWLLEVGVDLRIRRSCFLGGCDLKGFTFRIGVLPMWAGWEGDDGGINLFILHVPLVSWERESRTAPSCSGHELVPDAVG